MWRPCNGIVFGSRLFIYLSPQKTHHKKIQKANDPFIELEQLKIYLDDLLILLEDNQAAKVKELLQKLVPSYKSNTKIIDHIYEEKLNLNQDSNLTLTTNNQKNILRIK